jgi:hypothetical protein
MVNQPCEIHRFESSEEEDAQLDSAVQTTCSNVKANAFPALQGTDDLEEIVSPRVAGRARHSQFRLLERNVRCLGDFGKADSRMDAITQDGFAGGGVAERICRERSATSNCSRSASRRMEHR